MFARIWIVCAGTLLASTVYADISPAKLFLGNTSPPKEVGTGEAIIWRPAIDGLARYQLRLPRSGLRDALKYQDSSALFYMSQTSDLGLQLVRDQIGEMNISLVPEHSRMKYTHTQSLTHQLSFHLGVEVDSETAGPALGVSWRNVTNHIQLDQTTAALTGNRVNVSWTRTKLASADHLERLYSVSSHAGDFQASFGTRWFDFFQSTDMLAEVGFDDDAFVIGAQLERGIGSAAVFLGAVSNLSSGTTDFSLGVEYQLGKHAKVGATTQTGLISHEAQSLKWLRRTALPSHWRESVKLSAGTLKINAP